MFCSCSLEQRSPSHSTSSSCPTVSSNRSSRLRKFSFSLSRACSLPPSPPSPPTPPSPPSMRTRLRILGGSERSITSLVRRTITCLRSFSSSSPKLVAPENLLKSSRPPQYVLPNSSSPPGGKTVGAMALACVHSSYGRESAGVPERRTAATARRTSGSSALVRCASGDLRLCDSSQTIARKRLSSPVRWARARAPSYVAMTTDASAESESSPLSTTCTFAGESCSGSQRSSSARQLYLTLEGHSTSAGHTSA
mmetsp:Transcript_40418/g.133193  ORF Transcript_40418/g.133193 Transcript_40418/m.133193 type:complete len:253 (+) Transcript_40418:387-1145(+)